VLKIFYVAAHVFVMMECKKNYIFPALPSAVTMALGKEFFLKKIQTLPSAGQRALGKDFFF